jgi:2-polyprenyl-3-methyl-5-hydroxy-6-metoxy-1,4-benzoquinol methylase
MENWVRELDTEGRMIDRIVHAYDDPIIRLYCRGRFQILRLPFLQEIGQYLPREGMILDIGCGFGLFSLFYAMRSPRAKLRGIDQNSRRIATAIRVAQRLGLSNTSYEVGDATTCKLEGCFDGAYMLDVIHHIPVAAVMPLLRRVKQVLRPGSRLIIKDVDTRPFFKLWFTFALDKIMDYRTPVHYWESAYLRSSLEGLGLEVHLHAMRDYLPYPHVLYICRLPS